MFLNLSIGAFVGLVSFFQWSLCAQIPFKSLDPHTFMFLQVFECLYKEGLKCLFSSIPLPSLSVEAQETTGVCSQGDCCSCLIRDAPEPS